MPGIVEPPRRESGDPRRGIRRGVGARLRVFGCLFAYHVLDNGLDHSRALRRRVRESPSRVAEGVEGRTTRQMRPFVGAQGLHRNSDHDAEDSRDEAGTWGPAPIRRVAAPPARRTCGRLRGGSIVGHGKQPSHARFFGIVGRTGRDRPERCRPGREIHRGTSVCGPGAGHEGIACRTHLSTCSSFRPTRCLFRFASGPGRAAAAFAFPCLSRKGTQ